MTARTLPCVRRTGTIVLCLLLLGGVRAAQGQLRPLPAFPWEVFDAGRTAAGRLGFGVLERQRASLAGTEGRLLELGDFAVVWRSGRMAMELGGTVLRLFDEQTAFAPPYGGAEARPPGRRRDSGDYRVATAVHLTPPERPAGATLRFGARLPTTDNRVGLERDQTDFFALVGGRVRGERVRLSGELGVGIHGTREPAYEQSDVLAFTLSAGWQAGAVLPSVMLLGHADGLRGEAIRGNEELAELRAGVRAGRRFWVEAQLVRGLQTFSPRSGLLLSAGTDR